MMELTKENLVAYAAHYDSDARVSDKTEEDALKSILVVQRYLTKDQFVRVGIWKSPRQKKRYKSNDDVTVREITAFSFSAKTEQARLGALLALEGVSFPVASVILHFAFPERYPILDFRALWSLGWELPKSYNFRFWAKYCDKIRSIAMESSLSIRTVDKALWQYSKKNQK
ncbi:MAG: hypothetical protein Q7S09_04165 [bacterium]|nr:hypothetical protein [bacterium]